jgi:hypothetical protein
VTRKKGEEELRCWRGTLIELFIHLGGVVGVFNDVGGEGLILHYQYLNAPISYDYHFLQWGSTSFSFKMDGLSLYLEEMETSRTAFRVLRCGIPNFEHFAYLLVQLGWFP